MKDPFRGRSHGLTSPYVYAADVVPSDTADLAVFPRGLYVGVAGHVRLRTIGGSLVTFRNHPVGFLRVRCARVLATGTTAQAIVAVW